MINAEELLELVTQNDVMDILVTELDSESPKSDKNGLLFTTVCHHGDKRKLQYFSDSGFFKCYTECGSMSLYDVLMSANNWTFKEAFKFIADYKKVNLYKRHIGLKQKEYKNEDLDFLNKHLDKGKEKKEIVLSNYDEKILKYLSPYYPQQWEDEGITEEVARYYEIGFIFDQLRAVIPHRDTQGNLVGLRGRSFKYDDIQAGKKYMPVVIQGLVYKYPVAYNLYGAFQNKENIKNNKRVILMESEKSVMKHASFYGNENNICVALLGMSMSLYQRNLLLSLGVEEVIIALDKQYKSEAVDSKDKNNADYKEYVNYIKTLIKITKMFQGYCTVYIILSWEDEIGYRDSPIDKGKKVFEGLMRNKYEANVEEMEELIKCIMKR